MRLRIGINDMKFKDFRQQLNERRKDSRAVRELLGDNRHGKLLTANNHE